MLRQALPTTELPVERIVFGALASYIKGQNKLQQATLLERLLLSNDVTGPPQDTKHHTKHPSVPVAFPGPR